MWTPFRQRHGDAYQKSVLWLRLARLTVSAGFAAAVIAVSLRIPLINHATVALLLVLSVVGIATLWGSAEALIAAIAGGIGFDYYYLPPRGLFVEEAEYWVVLAAFLVTALATGQLAARSKQRRMQAVERQREMEMLYKLVNAMLETGGESALRRLAERLLEILRAEAVALYDNHNGEICRAGPRAGIISDQLLHETAAFGCEPDKAAVTYQAIPIRHAGEVVGSMVIVGEVVSPVLLSAIAARVGMGLAQLYAIERTTEAEVVRRSEELKSAMLDALAHEIRSPLNSVKMAATTLLSGRVVSEPNRREMLTIIDEEAGRMDRFIDEAVQLARMEANELSLRREPQEITRLISAAVEGMGALTAEREVKVRVPESLPPAECDKGMILRVLKQLLNNALKYSPPDSPLTVSAEFTGSAIVIDVVDRGPGVAEDERERIFEKYYRGRAARGGSQGTGLGLASAKCIVEAHGGEIWVTSAPGGGAAFHVSLPVSGASHTARVA
jgi:two-component system, OmpR family, sensor histidine kinase KdpD